MRHGDVFGVLGIGVGTVTCCAGLPVLLAFAGGLTVLELAGAGLVVAGAASAVAAVLVAARRRRACRPRRGTGS